MEIRLKDPQIHILGLFFSPDGHWLASLLDDKSILIWEMSDSSAPDFTARIVLPWQPDNAEFSKDNQKVIVRRANEELTFDEHGNQIH